MRAFAYLIVLMLASTAAAANLADPPTCSVPELAPACVHVIIGDIIIGNGDEQQFENGSYAMQGTVTVQDGGRAEFLHADVTWGTDTQPITVQAGGTLVIADLTVMTAAPGTLPVIRIEAGAVLIVSESEFDGISIVVESDDATIEDAIINNGDPGLWLIDSDAFVDNVDFRDNVRGLNVTRGHPAIGRLNFLNDQLAIQLYQTDIDLEGTTMNSVFNGLVITESAGTFTNMNMNDRSLPPDVGFEIFRSQVAIEDSTIENFGTAMRCDAASTVLTSGNTYSGNLNDEDCASTGT